MPSFGVHLRLILDERAKMRDKLDKKNYRSDINLFEYLILVFIVYNFLFTPSSELALCAYIICSSGYMLW